MGKRELTGTLVALALPLACGGQSDDSDATTGGGSGGTSSGGTSSGGTSSGGTSSGGGVATGGSGGTTACTAGLADCDGNAANGCEAKLAIDPLNCGACGVQCAAGETCALAKCAADCPSGLTACNGTCANTDVDPANCGACGNTCKVGSYCAAGSCVGGTGGTGGTGGSGGTGGCPTAPVVEAEKVTAGSPTWTALSWAAYATACGTPANGGAECLQAEKLVWGPNHVFDTAKNMFKSAAAHAPPYTNELLGGIQAAGYKNTGCFKASDLAAPKGIVISTVLVPTTSAPNDVSFEVPASGPVIAVSSLSVDGDLYRNGQLIDPYFDSSYPKAAFAYDYQPPFDKSTGGYAHIPLNWAENDSFTGGVPLPAGDYAFVVKLSDGANATSQTIRFVVLP